MNNPAVLTTRDKFLIPFAVAAVIFYAYGTVLFSRYGYVDDYFFLIYSRRPSCPLTFVTLGRPLWGPIFCKAFQVFNTIDGLAWLRSFTLLAMELLGCWTFYFCRSHRLGKATSLSIAIGLLLLPSFQVYAAWAVFFFVPVAALLALVSSHILGSFPSRSLPAGRLALAIGFLGAAMLVYQPIAMIFLMGTAISMISALRFGAPWRTKRFLEAGLVFAAGSLIGLLAVKIGGLLFPDPNSRFSLVADFVGKMRWFFSEPLANAVSLYLVPPSRRAPEIIGILIITGIGCLIARQGAKRSAGTLAVMVMLPIAGYLPNLATAENSATYRTIVGMEAVILACTISMVAEIGAAMGRIIRARLIAALPGILAGCFIFLAATGARESIYADFVNPSATEFGRLITFLKTRAAELAADAPIVVRNSLPYDSPSQVQLYEMGSLSSIDDPHSRSMVTLAVEEVHRMPARPVFVAESEPDRAIFIDFPSLIRGRVYNPRAILVANLNNADFQKGIRISAPGQAAQSFAAVYVSGRILPQKGDRIIFASSGTRVVMAVKGIDLGAGASLAIIDVDQPLAFEDGYPAAALESAGNLSGMGH
ncbi:MAG TPA: glucosyltransferase domain-containing protein [Dongiaceae bacterium]|jgi:hypothetical protein|nr:glucosyltransferase domain-containing protein [Dongiaceae bacterium]